MGSDNLFHKNRKRETRDLDRKQQHRQEQPRILIACEDSKSSAYYFQDMAKSIGLKAVEVRGKECGSAPSSVLEYAKRAYERDLSIDPYDRVYCVFDRDQHGSFEPTVREIGRLNQNGKPFYAVTSIPCFEIWLLMHFGKITRPFHSTGRHSSCDQVISLLRKEKNFSQYGKGQSGIYNKLSEHQKNDAIGNAERLVKDNKKTNSNNPSTNIHELVEYLIEISRCF